jgi:protein-S-isoprenylcysteine O-methyltransferase Ste14
LSRYFYVPILLLIGWYTLISLLRDKKHYEKRDAVHVILKSAGKYVFWGLVIMGVRWFYKEHPAYNVATPHTREFLGDFFYGYVWVGWPYFFLEEKYRYCRDNVLADPFNRLVVLIRSVWNGDFSRFRRRLFSTRNRRTLLSWMIRIHYIPIMVEQVHHGLVNLRQGYWFHDGSLSSLAFMVATVAWMIDSNNASIGYFWQSAFTKTRFRDVDPHPSHWILVLMCYTPFIYFVNEYFAPFPALPEDGIRMFGDPSLNTVIDLAMLTALVMYMLSGCSLAFSYSNLCYKSIQTRGAYGLVRHPATTCKLAYFTLAFFRFLDAREPRWLVCYVLWISVYIGRALVEERFLRRFPEYKAYMKKTRYRFFPGIA